MKTKSAKTIYTTVEKKVTFFTCSDHTLQILHIIFSQGKIAELAK